MHAEDWDRLAFARDKLREAYSKKYAPAGAAVVFPENFGFYPPFDWAKGAVFGENSTPKERKTARKHLPSGDSE